MSLKEYELKLDFDFKIYSLSEFARQFVDKLRFLQRFYGIYLKSIEIYETNKGYHFYLKVTTERKLNNKDIVVLQLALGSDYKRELFNWLRVRRGQKFKHWNVLFKCKYENGLKVSEERKTESAIRLEKLVSKLYFNEYKKA